VRREPGGVVRVTGSRRVPTVVVAWRGGEFLVDADGRVMADPGPSDALSAEFLRVRGPMLGPVRDDSGRVVYGAPWPGGDVQEAIGLLAYLHEREGALLSRIAAVDLSAYESTPAGELRLVTDRGGVLVWGAPVGASAGGEVSVDRKVEQLRAVLEELREIDRAGSVIPVNLPGVYLDQTIGRAAGGASDG
jgi:hypothetical protein